VDYVSFVRAVDAGRVPPVILVHGPELFLVEDAVRIVVRAVLGDDVALGREVLDAREAGAAAIARAADTLPLLAARRVVVVRGVDGLPAKGAEPLITYVASPNPATTLVLAAEDELGGAHWLLRAVPATDVVTAARLGRGAGPWLRARARRDGLEVGEDAAALLVELIGDDAAVLLAEAEKAALAGGPDNRRVGVAEVRAAVGEQRARRIFELSRAVEQRDLAAALGVLEALLGAGEEPLGLLGLLTRESELLAQVRRWRRAGRPPAEIARDLRRPERAAAALVAVAERASGPAVARRLEACWEAERRLKSGGGARAELTLLLAELCAA